MEVRFATPRLRKCYESMKAAVKEWGEKIARLYKQRVDGLYAAPDSATLGKLKSLDLHPLKGSRKGQHAIRLDGFYRLILSFQAKDVVTVEEVSKHYDD